MRALIIFWILTHVFVGYSQAKKNNIHLVKQKAIKFYDLLLNQDFVSNRDFFDLFGKEAREVEAYYLYELCESDPFDQNCMELAINALEYETHKYPSTVFKYFKEHKNWFANKLEFEELENRILESPLIGSKNGIMLDLKLNDQETIHFGMNYYEGESDFIGIIMPDGKLEFDLIYKSDQEYRFHRLGLITDPDGYTNLRDSTGTNYPVVQKVVEDQLFRYWPTSESTWWKVKTLDSCKVGYMHKSRIKVFNLLEGEVSEDLKKQAERAYDPDSQCR